jgi:hypothetical protein
VTSEMGVTVCGVFALLVVTQHIRGGFDEDT